MTSMSTSKTSKALRAVQEVHVMTLQALVEVGSKSGSFIVDLSTSIGLHVPFYNFI